MLRLIPVAAMCIVLAAGIAAPVLAQDQGTQIQAQVTRNEKIRDWTIICAQPPSGGPERCNLIQQAPAPDGKRLLLEAEVGIGPKGPIITFTAPTRHGLSVAQGMLLKVDGGEPVRVPFLQCLPQLCIAAKLLDDSLSARLRAGSNAEVIYLDGRSQPQSVGVSLMGFTSGVAQVK